MARHSQGEPLLGGSICEEIPPNPQQIDTTGLSTESGATFYAY